MEPCPDCEAFRQIVDPVPRHVHWCHERIAELEARPEDGHHSYHCGVCDWWLLRAEKAEAEVERLRRICERFDLDLYEPIRKERVA